MILNQKQLQPNVIRKDSRFLEDVLALFSGSATGNLYEYLYSSPASPTDPVRGEELLDDIYAECDDYYLFRSEKRLIKHFANNLSEMLGDAATLIDYGPGPARSFFYKTYPVLSALQNPNAYIPVDICPEYVAECKEAAKGMMPDLYVHGIADDYFDARLHYGFYKNPVVYFTGSSIANCPEIPGYAIPHNTLSRLQRIKGQIGGHGQLVIGHDQNQDEQSLLSAYKNPAAEKFILNLLDRIRRDLNTSYFDRAAFDHWVEWDAVNHCVKQGSILNRDATFRIGDHSFSFKKGDTLHFVSSYKYPRDLFIQTAQTAGFTHEQTFSLTDNPMVMHVFST